MTAENQISSGNSKLTAPQAVALPLGERSLRSAADDAQAVALNHPIAPERIVQERFLPGSR